jgi:hypothetical protein
MTPRRGRKRGALSADVERAPALPETVSSPSSSEPEARWTRVAEGVSIVVILAVVDRLFERAARLPPSAFATPWVGLAIVRHASPLTIAGVATLIGLAVWTRAWKTTWNRLGGGWRPRIVFGGTATVLAWAYATNPVDLIIDRDQSIDRSVLILLAAGTWWRPVIGWPFAALVRARLSQFAAPLPGFSVAEPSMLIAIVELAGVAAVVAPFRRRALAPTLWIVALALVAAHYFRSGLGKLALEWWSLERVHHVLASTYETGWLGFVERSRIETALRFLAYGEPILVAGTLVLEIGAPLAFLFRTAPRCFLGAWMLFHAGVFALSGICFWKWVVLDGLLLVAFGSSSRAAAIGAGNWRVAALFGALVVAGPIWARPRPLVWIDTPVAYTYRFYVIDGRGAEHFVPPSAFAPFDYQFTQGTFPWLVDASRLDLVWGATRDPAVARALLEVRSIVELESVEAKLGKPRADALLRSRLCAFLDRYFSSWNGHSIQGTGYSWLRAPPLLWSWPSAESLQVQDGVRAIKAREVTSIWNGNELREVRSVLVLEFPLSSARMPVPSLRGASR